MKFALACAQFAPEKTEVAGNLDRIAEFANQASKEGAELVLFPEASTTGYFLEGGVIEGALSGEDLRTEVESRLKSLKGPLGLVIGFYETHEGNFYNSAAYIEAGPRGARLVHTYRKFFLPTYGVFDEERFVSRGKELGVFETRLGRIGILICEDVWHSVLPTLCAVSGAQLLCVPSASPARGFSGEEPGNRERYRRMLKAVSEEHAIFAANVQLCGFEGGKGFIGGSLVYDPFGNLIGEGPLQEEHLFLAEIDFELVPIARAKSPLLSDLQSAWGDIERIVKNVGGGGCCE